MLFENRQDRYLQPLLRAIATFKKFPFPRIKFRFGPYRIDRAPWIPDQILALEITHQISIARTKQSRTALYR